MKNEKIRPPTQYLRYDKTLLYYLHALLYFVFVIRFRNSETSVFHNTAIKNKSNICKPQNAHAV